MTPREKILRSGLGEIIGNYEAEVGSVKSNYRTAKDTIEQADAAKDTHPSGGGPSEWDKRQYTRFKNILFEQKDRLTWREAKELFRLVSRSWGIE